MKLLQVAYRPKAVTHLKYESIMVPLCGTMPPCDYWVQVEGDAPTCKRCLKILAEREKHGRL